MRSRGEVNLTNMKDRWGIISTRTVSTSELKVCMCDGQRISRTDKCVCLGVNDVARDSGTDERTVTKRTASEKASLIRTTPNGHFVVLSFSDYTGVAI